MRRGRWGSEPEILVAAATHGVITVAELGRLGVASRTVYGRCRNGGPWRRLLPGIVMLSNGEPTPTQLVAGAARYGGPTSVVTGLHACQWHGIRRGPGPGRVVHLLVPHDRQLRASEYVVVERSRRLPSPVVRRGIRLAPVPRACVDAARRLRCPREVTELLADAVQRGLCEVPDLVAEVAAGGRRGSGTPRTVLADIGTGVRSAAERDAKRLWPRTGLPEPWWNAAVYDERNRLLAVVDGWCDDVGLAWEIDSKAFHLAPEDYERTVRRRARLVAAGVLVVQTLPTQLRRDAVALSSELRAAYASAATRPRPAVRAVRAPTARRGGPGDVQRR